MGSGGSAGIAEVPGMECCGVWRSSQCHAAGPWNKEMLWFQRVAGVTREVLMCGSHVCFDRGSEYGKVDL